VFEEEVHNPFFYLSFLLEHADVVMHSMCPIRGTGVEGDIFKFLIA